MNHFERITRKQSFKVFTIILLLFSLLMTSLPRQIAIAANGFSDEEGIYGSIRNEVDERDYERAIVDKKVSFGDKPGEYFIDLTIKGKDATKIDTTDIVLVYDNSYSMRTNSRDQIAHLATRNFVNDLLNESGAFRIGLVTFASWVNDNLSYKGLTNNANTIT